MHLVIYGDFNCPFSALASDRAARLEQTGTATVDWRAVEHAPDISRTGDSAASIEEVDRELEQVYALLVDGEDLHLARPARPSNSRAAVEAYAAVEPNRRADAASRCSVRIGAMAETSATSNSRFARRRGAVNRSDGVMAIRMARCRSPDRADAEARRRLHVPRSRCVGSPRRHVRTSRAIWTLAALRRLTRRGRHASPGPTPVALQNVDRIRSARQPLSSTEN